MAIYHVVALQVAPEHISKACDGFFSLIEKCKRNGKTYVRSIEGGKQCSRENFHGDLQVVFLVVFENQEDCDYYTFEDPAHEDFKKDLRSWGLAGASVLDFEPGKF